MRGIKDQVGLVILSGTTSTVPPRSVQSTSGKNEPRSYEVMSEVTTVTILTRLVVLISIQDFYL